MTSLDEKSTSIEKQEHSDLKDDSNNDVLEVSQRKERTDDLEELKSATKYEGTPEERRLVRKLDGRIMPLACVLYLFACRLSPSLLIVVEAQVDKSCRFG